MSSSDKKVTDAENIYKDDYIYFKEEKVSVAELAEMKCYIKNGQSVFRLSS